MFLDWTYEVVSSMMACMVSLQHLALAKVNNYMILISDAKERVLFGRKRHGSGSGG